MSTVETEVKPKITRNRFKGELTLGDFTDEAPVSRGSNGDLSPYINVIQASLDKKAQNHPAPAVGMTVPADGVNAAKTRFNAAAKEMGKGVSLTVKPHDHPDVRHLGLTPAHARLIVEGRERKNTGPKAKRNAETAEVAKPEEAIATNVAKAPTKGLPKVNR